VAFEFDLGFAPALAFEFDLEQNSPFSYVTASNPDAGRKPASSGGSHKEGESCKRRLMAMFRILYWRPPSRRPSVGL
jgi:hypothetical protein